MATTTNAPAATYGVHSEVGKLRKVMVCRPGSGAPAVDSGQLPRPAVRRRDLGPGGSDRTLRLRADDARTRHRRGRDARPAGRNTRTSRRRAAGCSTARSIPIRSARSDWTSSAPGWTRCLRKSWPSGSLAASPPAKCRSTPYTRLQRPHRSHPLRRAAAAQHAVHPRHHLLDLRRREPESDVLAGAAPGNAADHRLSTSSTRASATPSSPCGSAIRTWTTTRPRWRAAT